VATAIQRCGIARASGARCQLPPVGSLSIARGASFGSTGNGLSAGIGADGQSAMIRRAQCARNPRSALRVEAIAKLLPREPLTPPHRVRAPDLLPEMLAPQKFILRERRLVRVDVHLIGIHAHAQLLIVAPSGCAKEARLRAAPAA
jgi:hypothetical protein